MRLRIISILLIITPFIDCLNGFSISHSIGLPVGSAFRVLLFAWLSVCFITTKLAFPAEFVVLLGTAFYLISDPLFRYLLVGSGVAISYDIAFSLKLLLSMLVAIGCYQMYRYQPMALRRVINICSWYVPFTLLIPYALRIGSYTYFSLSGSRSVGYKGFYFSNNALNVVLIILLIFSIDKLFQSRFSLLNLIQSSLVLCSMLLIGSKSSFVYAAFMIMVYVFKSLKSIKAVVFSSVVILATVVSVVTILPQQSASILNRQLQLFHEHNFISYLLSERNVFLSDAIQVFKLHSTVFTILFGKGAYQMDVGTGMMIYGPVGLLKTVEMDPFDIFFGLGLIGLVLFLWACINILYKCYRLRMQKEVRPWLLSFVSLLLFSILGGHVVTEALSGTFFGMICAGILAHWNTNRSLLTNNNPEEVAYHNVNTNPIL